MNYFLPLAAVAVLALFAGCSSTPHGDHEGYDHDDHDERGHDEHGHAEHGKLRHVVLFKYKDTATQADIQNIVDEFRKLPTKIDSIVDFEYGENNSPEGLDMGYTHVFLVTFNDDAGRAKYLPHPAHKAFVEVLMPHIEEVHVMDYFAKK